MHAECQINEFASGIDRVSLLSSLRIEEVRSFKGRECLIQAQNSFEDAHFITESTRRFVDSGTIYVVGNWTSYVTSATLQDFEFLKNCKKIVDAVEVVSNYFKTRSLLENLHDAELRLRFFLGGHRADDFYPKIDCAGCYVTDVKL